MNRKKKLVWVILVCLITILVLALLIYVNTYYRADQTALTALGSDDAVRVSQTDYGWFFDGPSEEDVLVFYPGAKVQETAYAPLLHSLAEQGIDVCLLKMPFRLAVLASNKAEEVLARYNYANRYVGGHSMGGAIAAIYAAGHSGQLNGSILLAAYPTKTIADDCLLLSIYGSEDGVLNMDKVSDGRQYAPARYIEHVIEGGNHAQFGNYGIQKGDRTASVSAEDQQKQAADLILESIRQNTIGGNEDGF